jgi:hypothetical protein
VIQTHNFSGENNRLCNETDEDTGTAEIPVDHYDNKPFRDLYYKKTKSDSQNNMQPLEENLQKTGLSNSQL